LAIGDLDGWAGAHFGFRLAYLSIVDNIHEALHIKEQYKSQEALTVNTYLADSVWVSSGLWQPKQAEDLTVVRMIRGNGILFFVPMQVRILFLRHAPRAESAMDPPALDREVASPNPKGRGFAPGPSL